MVQFARCAADEWRQWQRVDGMPVASLITRETLDDAKKSAVQSERAAKIDFSSETYTRERNNNMMI